MQVVGYVLSVSWAYLYPGVLKWKGGIVVFGRIGCGAGFMGKIEVRQVVFGLERPRVMNTRCLLPAGWRVSCNFLDGTQKADGDQADQYI